MAFVDDLATLCITGGAGTVVGTDIFIGSKANLPDSGAAFLTIRATGGAPPLRTQNEIAPTAWRRPTAQLVARALSASDAEDLIELAFLAVQGQRNVFINTIRYMEIEPIQEPFDLGLDSKKRPRHTFNVEGIRGGIL